MITSALAVPTLEATPASANHLGHYYSYAIESSDANHYTGVETYRPDGVYTVPTSSGCGGSYPYTDPVAFQPTWVIMNSGTPNLSWLEIGTAHPCTGARAWYYGYGYNGVYFSLYTRSFTTTGNHVFRIRRKSATDYRWDLCLDPSGAVPVCYTHNWGASTAGIRVESGYETYGSAITAPTTSNTSLHYTVYDGAFQNFASRDNCVGSQSGCGGTGSSTVYGRWETDTAWRYSQNSALG